jgi:hypothetical protein
VRETITIEVLDIDLIDREQFIKNKLATGRLQDLAEIANIGGEVPGK